MKRASLQSCLSYNVVASTLRPCSEYLSNLVRSGKAQKGPSHLPTALSSVVLLPLSQMPSSFQLHLSRFCLLCEVISKCHLLHKVLSQILGKDDPSLEALPRPTACVYCCGP